MNPVIRLATVAASMGAAALGNKVLSSGWRAIFKEDTPTDSTRKGAAKAARKEGTEPEDFPLWKILLWTIASGIVLQSLQYYAQKGATRALNRRPSTNRG